MKKQIEQEIQSLRRDLDVITCPSEYREVEQQIIELQGHLENFV